jgi:lipoprotein signal peptidase
MGGSLANFIDLALHGMVWDMIPFPWDTGHLCNLADIAIAAGAIIISLAAAKSLTVLVPPKPSKI